MTLPVALIPAALSAVRSLIKLNRKIGSLRAVSRLRNELPISLPPVAENIIRDDRHDRTRMENAFSNNTPHRKALLSGGLAPTFDKYLNDTSMDIGQRRRYFLRFLALYYQIEDAQNPPVVAPDITNDLEHFRVKSASVGGSPLALQIVRATAETLLEYLGDNASVFLAQSQHRVILSTLLREFAAETDLENDNPERILKSLLGSVALVAADPAHTLTDKPLAVLLIASLGQVRRDMGDDFVARIISRDGFDAVIADWLTRVATDDILIDLLARVKDLNAPNAQYDPSRPETLPAALQPIYGVISTTLITIGEALETSNMLDKDAVFQDVFHTALTGLSDHSDVLLRSQLADNRLMAQVLQTTLAGFSTHATPGSEGLIAPVFGSMLTTLTQALPELSPNQSLTKVQTLITDLANHLAIPQFQTNISMIAAKNGEVFTNHLLADLLGLIKTRSDLLLDGQNAKVHAVLDVVVRLSPDLLDCGLDRSTITNLFGELLLHLYPEDTANGGFAAEILPLILNQITQLDTPHLSAPQVQQVIRAYLIQFDNNRPIWQALFDNSLMPGIFDGLTMGLNAAALPSRLPAHLIGGLVPALAETIGRHGIALVTLATDQDAPETFIKSHLKNLITRALTTVFNRFGRGIDASHILPLAQRTLDLILSQSDLSDAEIETFLSKEIDLLNQR